MRKQVFDGKVLSKLNKNRGNYSLRGEGCWTEVQSATRPAWREEKPTDSSQIKTKGNIRVIQGLRRLDTKIIIVDQQHAELIRNKNVVKNLVIKNVKKGRIKETTFSPRRLCYFEQLKREDLQGFTSCQKIVRYCC
jgi:hypothetical protein